MKWYHFRRTCTSSYLILSFADDGNASWYSICRVPMVEWRLDCENCRHLTVAGLHDTGPWTSHVSDSYVHGAMMVGHLPSGQFTVSRWNHLKEHTSALDKHNTACKRKKKKKNESWNKPLNIIDLVKRMNQNQNRLYCYQNPKVLM